MTDSDNPHGIQRCFSATIYTFEIEVHLGGGAYNTLVIEIAAGNEVAALEMIENMLVYQITEARLVGTKQWTDPALN